MFTLFPQLPAELQLKIWDASLPRTGIHIFDVCFQEIDKAASSSEAEDEDAHAEHTFLSSLSTTPTHNPGAVSSTTFRSDPSTYKIANALSTTTIDSSKVVKSRISRDQSAGPNIVHLPLERERVSYNNDDDVLCLRFGLSCDARQEVGPLFRNNISRILEAEWSGEMASSLFSARRLAIDIAELWSPGGLDPMSMAYFCCCIQNDLEVLYLVDYCVGRCQMCLKGSLTSKELLKTKCGLAKELDAEDREMDVIHGSTVKYREISNFEKLGWNSDHSAFGLAKIMGDTIREQQGAEGPFRSVRILVCEEEVADTVRGECVEGQW